MMQRTVTARYESREAADAAREALRGIGIPAGGITIREPVQQPGVFDHLTRMLAPARAGGTEGEAYQLSAEVPPERVAQTMLVLGNAATSGSASMAGEQLFEFPETREELRVDKQQVVSEEVVLRKQVTERPADVNGTVRRTEVEVEEMAPPTPEAAPPAATAPPEEPLRFGLRARPQ